MKTPLLTALALLAAAPLVSAENWPQWRGPRGDGTSAETGIAWKWDGASGAGVAWKTELPGEGHSSPVVWGGRVFVTAVKPETEDRVLICLDAKSGRVLWERVVLKAPLERKHRENSHASSTPATDGERVYVSFLDIRDSVVAAFDFEGKQAWQARPGIFSSVHGYCASPLVFEDRVIINGDHDGDAWIAALSRKDGKTLWKIDRENKTRSYCTPLIRDLAGRTQMVLSGSKCVASYDPRTGKRHWIIDGPTEQFVASLVFNEKRGLLFMTGGFPELHVMGIRPDGEGNVTKTHAAWRQMTGPKGVSYVPSPISAGDWFFVLSDSASASCYDAANGEQRWNQKVGPHAHSSIVSAEGRLYFTTDDGATTIVKPGATYEELAKNQLGEACYSSPAISEGRLFIRGVKHLFCIGAK